MQRLRAAQGFSRLASARTMVARHPVELAEEIYGVAGFELAEAGFTLNLAPVVDLHDGRNPIIGRYARAFSADPAVVIDYARAAVRGLAAGGILAAVKHFPGHGTSRGDTHTGVVNVNATWSETELQPFIGLMKSGDLRLVMSCHVVHDRWGGVPASLSVLALVGELRGRIGFRGPIITDDLDMGGIRDLAGPQEAVLRAVEAGNDLILTSNSADHDSDLPAAAAGWIEAAVMEGRISAGRVAASAARIRLAFRRFA